MNALYKPTSMLVILGVASLLLFGCARLHLQSPSVTVVSMDVVEASLLEQRYSFKLRVQNPNDLDIAVTGMSFEIKVNDQPFAKGVSNKPVKLPRLGEAVLEVTAVSDLSGVISQIDRIRKGDLSSVSYLVKGRLVTRSFPDLNFESKGVIDIPMPGKGK